MNSTIKNEKATETAVETKEVVVVERAARLMGGVAVRTRLHAGKKAAHPA